MNRLSFQSQSIALSIEHLDIPVHYAQFDALPGVIPLAMTNQPSKDEPCRITVNESLSDTLFAETLGFGERTTLPMRQGIASFISITLDPINWNLNFRDGESRKFKFQLIGSSVIDMKDAMPCLMGKSGSLQAKRLCEQRIQETLIDCNTARFIFARLVGHCEGDHTRESVELGIMHRNI